MKLKGPLAVPILITAAMISIAAGSAGESPDRESSSYEVMSALIREKFGEDFGLILINSETEQIYGGVGYTIPREQWPELKKETIDSLITGNSGRSTSLEARFDLPVQYRLVSEKEYCRALQGGVDLIEDHHYSPSGHLIIGEKGQAADCDTLQPDWDNFDRTFPDAQGYLTFSRVGFDSKFTQALLIYSNSYRCSGNRVRPQSRKTAFFVRRGGSWELAGVSK